MFGAKTLVLTAAAAAVIAAGAGFAAGSLAPHTQASPSAEQSAVVSVKVTNPFATAAVITGPAVQKLSEQNAAPSSAKATSWISSDGTCNVGPIPSSALVGTLLGNPVSIAAAASFDPHQTVTVCVETSDPAAFGKTLGGATTLTFASQSDTGATIETATATVPNTAFPSN